MPKLTWSVTWYSALNSKQTKDFGDDALAAERFARSHERSMLCFAGQAWMPGSHQSRTAYTGKAEAQYAVGGN